MRSVKILILSILLCCALSPRAQYVQPMGYTDYSFWQQMNIGNNGAKITSPSAYLELGKFAGSTKGFLLPRGNKDSIVNPAKGLIFWDLPTNSIQIYNGTSWVPAMGPTLYNSDGNLPEARTINQAGFTLNFNGGLFNVTSKITSGNYGSMNINSSEARTDFNSTNGFANWRLIPRTGNAPYILMRSVNTNGQESGVEIKSDNGITFTPSLGRMFIDSLSQSPFDTAANKILVFNKSSGQMQSFPYWPGFGGGSSGPDVIVGNVAMPSFGGDSLLWYPPYNANMILARKVKIDAAASNKINVTRPSDNTDSTLHWQFDINEGNVNLANLGNKLNLSQLAQNGATTGQIVSWNGSAWVASTLGAGSESDPLSIHNQRAFQTNSFFNVNTGTVKDTFFFPGGAYATNYRAAGPNSTFIVFPNGVSGIGQNGPGVDVWLAHGQYSGQFFPDLLSDDLAYRNTSHNLLFGTGAGGNNSIMQIVHATQTMRLTKHSILADTTNYKPVIMDSVGNIVGRSYWFGSGTSGGSTPDLQAVTNVGSVTTNPITAQNMQLSASTLQNTAAAFMNLTGSNGASFIFSYGSVNSPTISNSLLSTNRTYNLPDVAGTLALTSQAVPIGGTAGQVLAKIDGTDYNTQWVAPGGGGGLSGLTTNNVPYATSSTTIGPSGSTGANGIYWDNTNNRLLINKTSGSFNVDVTGSIRGTGAMQTDASMTVGGTYFQQSIFSMGTGSSPYFEFKNSWANNGSYKWYVGDATVVGMILHGDKSFELPGYASGSTAPTTTGTKHMVTVDANGLVSHEAIPSGGGGTVTDFSAGDLSPLFTTTEATTTTTPALSFSLSNAAANSVFGNNTSSSAAPAYFASSANGQVLVQHSGTLGFAALAASDIPSGATSYIQNQNAGAQSSASFFVDGSGRVGTSMVIGSMSLTMSGANARLLNGTSNVGTFEFWVGGQDKLGLKINSDGSLTTDYKEIIGLTSAGVTGMTEGSKFSVKLDNSADGVNMGTFRVNQTASSTNVSSALQPWLRTTHSSGTVADVRTFVSVYDQGSANAVTEARSAQFSGLISNTTAGTIGTLKLAIAKMDANTGTAGTVDNYYGFYHEAPGGSGTLTFTNQRYAFYNNDAGAASLFKGKFFLPSLGTTTTNKILGHVTSSGELVPITVGTGLDLTGNTLTSTSGSSSTYTPTVSGLSNIAGSTVTTTNYCRIGNVVIVSMPLDVSVTTANSTSVIKFSLPVSSNLGAVAECTGNFTTLGTEASGAISADAANDVAQLTFKSTTTSTVSGTVTFMYIVH
jgi:hypothetical protein